MGIRSLSKNIIQPIIVTVLGLLVIASGVYAPRASAAGEVYRWSDDNIIATVTSGAYGTVSGLNDGKDITFTKYSGPDENDTIIYRAEASAASCTLHVQLAFKSSDLNSATTSLYDEGSSSCLKASDLAGRGTTVSGTPPTSATQPTEAPSCDNTAEPAALRYFACPAIEGLIASIDKVDTFIQSLLDFNVKAFEDSEAETAWKSFRTIAYALIFIAGLVIVIGQAAGAQIMDAYTIKKALPRLLVAVLFIALSWNILIFIVTFFNDIGRWTQDLLLEPFAAAQEMNAGKLIGGGATLGVGGVVGGGAAVIYLSTIGLAGTAVLLLTFVFSVLIGLAVLSVRTMIITLALIIAPFAIACMILPATQKVWDLWRKALTTALVVFPIIMAMLAAGKIAASITTNGIMAVLFYIAPYFLIPFTFRFAGGLVGRIAGMTNDKTRGIFDRGRNFRKARYERGRDEFAQGKRNTNGITAGVAGFHRRNALAQEGGWSFNKDGRMRYDEATRQMRARTSAKLLEESGGRIGDDDALDLASDVTTTRDNFVTRYAERYAAKNNVAVGSAEAQQAALRARANIETGFNSEIGTSAMQATAFRGWATSPTSIETKQGAEADVQVLGERAARLASAGVLSRDDAIATIKSAGKRAEFSAAGFGPWQQNLQSAIDRAKDPNLAPGEKIFTEDHARSIVLDALDGARSGDIVMSNKRTVTNLAPAMLRSLEDKMASPEDFTVELASLAGRYDAMSSANPMNAKIMRDGLFKQVLKDASGKEVMHTQEVVVRDATGKPMQTPDGKPQTREVSVPLTVQMAIDLKRSDPVFTQMRREYGSAAAASQFAADEAAHQAAQPPEEQR